MKSRSVFSALSRLRQRLRPVLSRSRRFVKDVLYPEEALCLVCGAVVRSGSLCETCRASLLQEDFFSFWAYESLDGVPAYSLRPHRSVARRLVLELKHQAAACAAEELAALLLPLPDFLSFTPDTVVTWVPMPARRRRERCIDHGRVLAEAFAARLNLPCRQLLIRRNDGGRTQASLNRKARQANLRHAFGPAGPVRCPVLLVDDVLTTGTTALRCIEVLRKAGAPEITVLTATRAARSRTAGPGTGG